MTVRIVHGNALDLPLEDGSVDLIVTSPPYFGLRSYQDGGQHYDGQIGDEPTPAEFVDALIAATREMVRVIKPSGSIWVNLGDKYASGSSGLQGASGLRALRRQAQTYGDIGDTYTPGIRHKSLIGVPWRYALRCIDDLGLILRAEVIWSKPNGLPESVTDRVRRSHETWFHFTTQPRYFSCVDEVREESKERSHHEKYAAASRNYRNVYASDSRHGASDAAMLGCHPLGKLPGSVWTIPTQPLRVPDDLGIDHFAAFPMEWPRRIIKGWSPSGVCVECGEGRRPVTERRVEKWQTGHRKVDSDGVNMGGGRSMSAHRAGLLPNTVTQTITGYICACPEPSAHTTPAVVLDPFGGTGTTALVAHSLGRHGISVDLSRDYCRLAEWRTSDPGELARAMQVEKPPKELDGQDSLFGDAS